MAIDQQPNTPLLITIGAVSGFLLLVLFIGVQAWFLREVQTEVHRKYDDVPVQPVSDLKLGQSLKINEYRWVDKAKGQVAIPIDDAMKLIIANQGLLPATQPAGPKG